LHAARVLSWFGPVCYFFFSSRRRHTSSKRDWSSDVCSSDLLKDGKFHLVRPYYRNEVSLIKTALGLGTNIYTNYAFWRREIFETSVYENYLINGMPAWYNAENNLGL